MKKEYGLIYRATNLVDDDGVKDYIGQSTEFEIRKTRHIYAAFHKNASDHDVYFHRAIRKYGKEAFMWEIILDNIPVNELAMFEMFYIALFGTYGEYGYNETRGGEGASGHKQTDETKKKISNAQIGKKNHNFGKHASNEVKRKMSESRSGENSPLAKISFDDAKEIRELNLKGNFTQKEIGCQFGISAEEANHIIRNLSWYDKEYVPPEKFTSNMLGKLSYEIAEKIRKNFEDKRMLPTLAEKYMVCEETIRLILRNKIWYDENYIVPEIISRKTKLSNEDAHKIRSMYLSGNYTQHIIAEQFSVTDSVINKIISNKILHNENYIVSNTNNKLILTLEQAEEIRILYAEGKYTYRELANKFGVSTPTINSILSNRAYTEQQGIVSK